MKTNTFTDVSSIAPVRAYKTLLNIIAHFTPTWFAMTMGTGIIAVVLHLINFSNQYRDAFARGIWIYNLGLFSLFTTILLARTFLFPQSWRRLFASPSLPMFLSCIPMGMMTIINGAILLFANEEVAKYMPVLLFAWCMGVIISVLCILIVPYLLITKNTHRLENISAVWLLPFVACEVSAASGALMLPILPPTLVLPVLITLISLWSLSIILSMLILSIFVLRLILHKLPSADLAASIFLPLGPTSTGALALFLLAKNASAIPLTGSTSAVVTLIQILPGIGLIGGIILWSFATWWLAMASVFTLHYIKNQSLKFSLGCWAYTFPLGVYTIATLNLAKLTNVLLLITYGDIVGAALIGIWIVVTVYTLHGGCFGNLIHDTTLNTDMN